MGACQSSQQELQLPPPLPETETISQTSKGLESCPSHPEIQLIEITLNETKSALVFQCRLCLSDHLPSTQSISLMQFIKSSDSQVFNNWPTVNPDLLQKIQYAISDNYEYDLDLLSEEISKVSLQLKSEYIRLSKKVEIRNAVTRVGASIEEVSNELMKIVKDVQINSKQIEKELETCLKLYLSTKEQFEKERKGRIPPGDVNNALRIGETIIHKEITERWQLETQTNGNLISLKAKTNFNRYMSRLFMPEKREYVGDSVKYLLNTLANVRNLTSLTLNLESIELGKEGLEELRNIPLLKDLKTLNLQLGWNFLYPGVCEELGVALMGSNQLSTLNIDFGMETRIGEKGIKELRTTLSHLINLTSFTLHFTYHSIKDDEVIQLGYLLVNLTNLRDLELKFNWEKITKETGMKLVDSLAKLSNLINLNLQIEY